MEGERSNRKKKAKVNPSLCGNVDHLLSPLLNHLPLFLRKTFSLILHPSQLQLSYNPVFKITLSAITTCFWEEEEGRQLKNDRYKIEDLFVMNELDVWKNQMKRREEKGKKGSF